VGCGLCCDVGGWDWVEGWGGGRGGGGSYITVGVGVVRFVVRRGSE